MSKIKYLTVQHFSWGVLLLLIFVLQFYHSELFQLLRYERQGIIAGEFWRLISGHFVHLSWGHSWLNMAGYMLILGLFGKYFSAGVFFLTIALSLIVIDIGLFTIHTEIHWYVGFSGVLHGLFLSGLLFAIKIGRHPSTKWLLALLLIKIAWEMFAGSLPGTAQMSGGKVIVEAHFYGAVGGLMSFSIAIVTSILNGFVNKLHIARKG